MGLAQPFETAKFTLTPRKTHILILPKTVSPPRHHVIQIYEPMGAILIQTTTLTELYKNVVKT